MAAQGRKTEMSVMDKVELIRSVADRLLQEGRIGPEDDILREWRIQADYDYEIIWAQMRIETLTKLNQLRLAKDCEDAVPEPDRMLPINWFLFNQILVHQDFDFIGKRLEIEEFPVLDNLFKLVKTFHLEDLTGGCLSEAWLQATSYYNKHGHQCAPMLLQRRWHQLKEHTRDKFYKFSNVVEAISKTDDEWNLDKIKQFKPTELQIDIVTAFKPLITQPLLSWEQMKQLKLVTLFDEFEWVKTQIVARGEPAIRDPSINLGKEICYLADSGDSGKKEPRINSNTPTYSPQKTMTTENVPDCPLTELTDIEEFEFKSNISIQSEEPCLNPEAVDALLVLLKDENNKSQGVPPKKKSRRVPPNKKTRADTVVGTPEDTTMISVDPCEIETVNVNVPSLGGEVSLTATAVVPHLAAQKPENIISPPCSTKLLPTPHTLKNKCTQNFSLEPTFIKPFEHSKKIIDRPEGSFVHLGKNKILLTTFKFPSNLKLFHEAIKVLKPSFNLPYGVYLKLLSDGKVSWEIDPLLPSTSKHYHQEKLTDNEIPEIAAVRAYMDAHAALEEALEIQNVGIGGEVTQIDIAKTSCQIENSNVHKVLTEQAEAQSETLPESATQKVTTEVPEEITKRTKINNIALNLMEMSDQFYEDTSREKTAVPAQLADQVVMTHAFLDPHQEPTYLLPASEVESPAQGSALSPTLAPVCQGTTINPSELTQITFLYELKYACVNKGKLYKFDMDTGNLTPINVCIKSRKKQVGELIDLTGDDDNPDQQDTEP